MTVKGDARKTRSKKNEKDMGQDTTPTVIPAESELSDIEKAANAPGNATGAPDADSEILTLPVLPLRGTVVFPLTVVPLAAAQPRSLRLIDEVMSGDRTVALVMQKDAELEGAGPDDVYDVGTISTIHQMMRVPDGTVRLAVQGNERMRILEFLQEEPYLDGAGAATRRRTWRNRSRWRR